MLSHEVHRWFVAAEFVFAAVTFVALLFIAAPYGRHSRSGWGPTLNSRWGWLLMEAPTWLVFLPVYFGGARAGNAAPLVLLGLWLSHYLYRGLVFPFRLRRSGKRLPLVIVGMGILFNVQNAFVVAPQLSEFGNYQVVWLSDPRFLFGTFLFASGMWINRRADSLLIRLGRGKSGEYQIPQGGLFRWISCPNYLGEIIQWLGFAVASWSLAGLAFACFTVANVGPRALSHHRYYREQFPQYPQSRRALLPFLL